MFGKMGSSRIRRLSGKYEGIQKEKVDCVVIGAGIVGIVVARALSLMKREVLVVESCSTFGTGTSSRNSEVIHAGIYYLTNSLKATLCVKGRELLYKYCLDREIPHKQVGKLIVATRSLETPKLKALLERGKQNGVEGLRMMESSETMLVEPDIQCVKALWSPYSGIVDSHSLMLSLVGDAENQGTTFAYNTAVIGGIAGENNIQVCVVENKDIDCYNNPSLEPSLILQANVVVNCAGLSAFYVAKRLEGLINGVIPESYFARGCYFTLAEAAKPPLKHLIYPIPEDGGLGVHVTVDMGGQIKFGPDVEWLNVDDTSIFLNRFDYSVEASRAERFYPEIRKYYPNLKDGSLVPGYAGIRPKLSGSGQGFEDFMIQGEEVHGVRGLINLFGIESPGLTASMAIADYLICKYIN